MNKIIKQQDQTNKLTQGKNTLKNKQYDQISDMSKRSYAFDEVIDEKQFVQLSKEIKMEVEHRQKLMDSLYYSRCWKNASPAAKKAVEPISLYEKQYQAWKKKKQSKSASNLEEVYENTLNLINKDQIDKQRYILKASYKIDKAIFKFKQQNPILTRINNEYESNLRNIINKERNVSEKSLSNINMPSIDHSSIHNLSSVKDHQQEEYFSEIKKNQIIEREVQKQILQRITNMNQSLKIKQDYQRKNKQIAQTCFINLIKYPPQIHQSKQRKRGLLQEKINEKHENILNYIEFQEAIKTKYKQIEPLQKKVKQKRWKLNIQQILKIPHKLFLIFYSEHQHKLTRLTAPEQLKQIQRYRDEALKREEAVQKLRQKVAENGDQIIKKLHPQQRQKLFNILYQKDIEVNKYYDND